MKRFIFIIIINLFALFNLIADLENKNLEDYFNKNVGVTYGLSEGRFGDNLLSYMHGKWLEFKYNIPLFYQPFLHSNQLMLDEIEILLSDEIRNLYTKIVTMGGINIDLNTTEKTLYIIPYFSEYSFEWQHGGKRFYNRFSVCKVEWDNEEFRHVLKKVVVPKIEIKKLDLPQNRISVALHVRTGGGFDMKYAQNQLPLKFAPLTYYIENLGKIIQHFNDSPLYVHIFTDDPNPEAILDHIKASFPDNDIAFGCRNVGNSHDGNVLEDFFNLTQFNCLIRPQSNFSFAAAKITDYLIEISPEEFERINGQPVVTKSNIKLKKD